MEACCEAKGNELKPLAESQRRVLWIVLLVNLSMFFIESIAGIIGRSSSLNADALDMLGDSMVYAVSPYALNRSTIWKVRISLFKGALMLVLGLFVLGQTLSRVLS